MFSTGCHHFSKMIGNLLEMYPVHFKLRPRGHTGQTNCFCYSFSWEIFERLAPGESRG